MKKKAVHFDAQGIGLYIPGHAECGAYKRQYYVEPNLPMSTRPSEVTCECCKKTAAFRKVQGEAEAWADVGECCGQFNV